MTLQNWTFQHKLRHLDFHMQAAWNKIVQDDRSDMSPSLIPRLFGGGVREKKEPGTHRLHIRLIIARLTTRTIVGIAKMCSEWGGVCIMM